MVDVDFFKAYNDSQGHLAGDECLKQVARVFKQSLKRPLDFAARYGGEEFAVLIRGDMAAKAGLPETLARTAALEAVERFRDVWPRERANLPVSKDVAAEIERLLAAVPIASGR